RTATNDEEWKNFAPAKTNQFAKRCFIPRLDPKLRRATDAQSRVLRERFVKSDVAIFTDDLFQSFSDDEIGSQDRQLFVNVTSAEAENEIAGLKHVAHVAMHQFQFRLVTRAGMSVR